ncbi:MAG: hypothetical protein QXV81_02500 [Ignisphaera sp.]
MIEVDVAIVGSGIAAIRAASVARDLGRSYLAVDSTYGRGGYVGIVGRVYRYLKSPLFIPQKLVELIRGSGIADDIRCYSVERCVVKEGPIERKILGYRSVQVQRNWFIEWLEQKTLCYTNTILQYIESLLRVSLIGKSITASSIRKIDLDRGIMALSNGVLIRFRKLVYTWPLDLLPRYIYMEKDISRIAELVGKLNLDYISIHTLSSISKEDVVGDTVQIYTHGTKASRFHTAIKIPVDSYSITYITTSYSSSHPLMPGATEKLFSESRKHRLIDTSRIVEYNVSQTVYALINQIDRNLFNELQQILQEYNTIPYGRLGMWRDYDIYTLVTEPITIDSVV